MKAVSNAEVRAAMRTVADGRPGPVGVVLAINAQRRCKATLVTGLDVEQTTVQVAESKLDEYPDHSIVYGHTPGFNPVWKRRPRYRHPR